MFFSETRCMFARICNKIVVSEMTDIYSTSLLEGISTACTRNEWANSLTGQSCQSVCLSVNQDGRSHNCCR